MFSRIAISTSNFESIGIDFIDEPTLLLMSPLKLSLLRDRFKREIDNMFIEAKRSTVATTAEIPSWFIILTILLGWNEFYLIISNPIYFLTLAMMCGGGYFLYLIGGTGPAFAIIKATFIESSKQAFDALEKNGITVEAAVDQVQSVFSSPAKNPEKKGVETIIEEDEN